MHRKMHTVIRLAFGTCMLCYVYSPIVTVQKSYRQSGPKAFRQSSVWSNNTTRMESVSCTHSQRTAVENSAGGVPRLPLHTFLVNVDRYGKWSKWSRYRGRRCTQYRYRECVDDSWMETNVNNSVNSYCKSKVFMEVRECRNKKASPASALPGCGVSADDGDLATKIIGGAISKLNAWPWAVRLSITSTIYNESILCGGTLITPSWIITAAHCFFEETGQEPLNGSSFQKTNVNRLVFAHIGDHHVTETETTQSDHLVKHIFLHPSFRPELNYNGADIALIYMAEPVKLRPEVTHACLPIKRTILKPGMKCYAVGWGEITSQVDTGSNNTQPSSLVKSRQSESRRESRQVKEDNMEVVEMHEVSLTVLSSDKCREYNKDLQEESTICAGSVGKDTCYGDSGGGLYCRLPNSKIWYIAGVTSFGDPNGCGKLPGVYTSVIAHAGWVQRVIRDST